MLTFVFDCNIHKLLKVGSDVIVVHKKCFIFKMRTQGEDVNIFNLQAYLKNFFCIGKYIILKKCKNVNDKNSIDTGNIGWICSMKVNV